MPIVKCQQCGKDFEISECRLKIGKGKFCSRECMNENNKKKEIHKKCEWCGKDFVAERHATRFCSRSCAGLKQHSRYKKVPKAACKNCGKIFLQKNIDKVFCSKKCGSEYFAKKSAINDPYEDNLFMHEFYIGGIYRQADFVLGF